MSLSIIGAGGFGREVLAYARDVGLAIAGFIDDRANALDGFEVGARVIGGLEHVRPTDDDRFVIAIGDPVVRWRVAGALAARGARFATIVHPTAYVAPGAQLGAGAVLAPFTFVGPSARLGTHAVLNTYASIGHDANVGTCAVFSPYAVANGATSVGAGAFLGTHAAVVLGASLGAWAKLGAGATAVSDIEAGMLALGTPARGRVMFRPPPERGPE